MKPSWFFVLFLLVLVAIFSVQNAAAMTVRFLAWEFTMSAALVVMLAAFLGSLIGLIVGSLSRRKKTAPVSPGTVPPQPSKIP